VCTMCGRSFIPIGVGDWRTRQDSNLWPLPSEGSSLLCGRLLECDHICEITPSDYVLCCRPLPLFAKIYATALAMCLLASPVASKRSALQWANVTESACVK
jgi:hypothetical protein